VIGQPYRIRALADCLDYVRKFEDMWFPKRDEIAEWYRDNQQDHTA
jgi:hypothetical protein